MNRLLNAAGIVLCVLALSIFVGVMYIDLATPPAITHAIGVISRCGIYAVATIDSSGAVELWDAVRQAPADVEAIVNALPPEARTSVLVPCPVVPPGVGL